MGLIGYCELFGNGERALAVHYSIYKNIIKGKDYINPESKLQNVRKMAPMKTS